MILPTVKMISGKGKPRLILVQGTVFYTNVGTMSFTSTTATEADGSAIAITSSSVANPTNILSTGHGLSEGRYVKIAGHSGSTPSLNGTHRVAAIVDANNYKIPVNVTVGGTGGTGARTPAFDTRGTSVGQRVSVIPSSSGSDPIRWGKITGVAASVLTIDEWVNGTPTNTIAGATKIDGWIADLPYCYELTETFTPDVLMHELYRKRRSTKHYGWLYRATMNYSVFISGDTMLAIRWHLNMKTNDRLILMPRKDTPAFNYNVYFSDSFDMSMFAKGQGHKKPVFVLEGKESISSFPILAGYGTNFGNLYGTGL